MAKIVYSLVLSSEIVAEVDLLAAQEGLSRSGFINRLLAQHTSLPTPEAHAGTVCATAAAALRAAGLRAEVTAGGALLARTALRYKYNPTLLYCFEPQQGGGHIGTLRVGVRSQNEGLLDTIGVFFSLFEKLEAAYLPAPPETAPEATGIYRFARALRQSPAIPDAQTEGKMVAVYTAHLNACIKSFFENLHDANDALRATEQTYLHNLSMQGGVKEL